MLRLHDALRERGHDSRVRYRKGNIHAPEARRLEYCGGWLDRQRERVRHRFETWALVPNATSHYGRCQLHKATPPPAADATADIIHLHCVSRWLDLPTFLSAVPKQIPIVWTIHDMSALAGGVGDVSTNLRVWCGIVNGPVGRLTHTPGPSNWI